MKIAGTTTSGGGTSRSFMAFLSAAGARGAGRAARLIGRVLVDVLIGVAVVVAGFAGAVIVGLIAALFGAQSAPQDRQPAAPRQPRGPTVPQGNVRARYGRGQPRIDRFGEIIEED